MTPERARVAIFVSGRGSNLRAILEARSTLHADVVGVLSSKPDAPALGFAAEAGVPTAALDAKGAPSRAAYDLRVDEALAAWDADFIVLAGYMRLLPAALLRRFVGRIVNIHPSLLPAFPGLRPHRQALERGVTLSGATVHFVTEGPVDGGPIIAQRAVPVEPGDDEDALAARILVAEHALYPAALREVLAGRARLEGERVVRALEGAR